MKMFYKWLREVGIHVLAIISVYGVIYLFSALSKYVSSNFRDHPLVDYVYVYPWRIGMCQ
jgi:hypothetical protein